MKISVAMASYNGEKYIKEQIASILPQLSEGDEIVISDDGSKDATLDIVGEFAGKDSRVKPIKGQGKGAILNFQNAIEHCSGQLIFLCDQDDVWLSNKVRSVVDRFKKTGADLVMHDVKVVNEELECIKPSFFAARGVKKGILKNIIKNSYMGCAMAFKSYLKDIILPFPKNLPMHDQWIGLICEIYGKVDFIDKPLGLYRRHGDNVTGDSRSDIFTMLAWRAAICASLLKRRILVSKRELKKQ